MFLGAGPEALRPSGLHVLKEARGMPLLSHKAAENVQHSTLWELVLQW